jgi:hypothetical protein
MTRYGSKDLLDDWMSGSRVGEEGNAKERKLIDRELY